jgi:anthranilate 1,2-dioxygenase (deaminating, decarboxylating) large subunit
LGITNFEDGFAAPGWLFEEFPEFYGADELKNSRGNTVSGRNRLTANSTTTHLVFVSDKSVFGGWLSFEALQPWVDVDVQLADASASRVRGFADLTLAGGLQWPPREIGNGVFVDRLMLAVGVPTGTYSDEQPLNLGNHFVVLDPYYALTYECQKLEFSARLHYLWNSVNHEPFVGFGVNNVQAGQAFHMNYAASYEAVKDVRVGVNGYWLQQTTDHKVNGLNVAGSLERTVGLGGGIQIFFGRETWFHLNANSETDVRSRARGFSVILRVTKGIPSAKTEG